MNCLRSNFSTYKDTPQWMKAPNGKPTRLTERQWVMVWTESFKKCFEDWETFAKQRELDTFVERVFETSQKFEPRLTTKSIWVENTTAGVKSSATSVYTPSRNANLLFFDGRVNSDSVSKVVDENGKSKVMYRGDVDTIKNTAMKNLQIHIFPCTNSEGESGVYQHRQGFRLGHSADVELSQADVAEIRDAITKNDSDPLPIPMDVSIHSSAMESLSTGRISNQHDLVKMRDEYPGYYQEGQNADLPRGLRNF
jgi:prepilin-type processing-associated H-X9-DG protein